MHDYQVSLDRIQVEIGKGGDKLVPSILGAEADENDGDSLRKAHTAEYTRIAESTHLAVFPGVEALLSDLKRRGLKLGLATSSSPGELQTTQRAAGVDWSEFFDGVATSADASDSKPQPAILQAAVHKLDMSPAQCLMVGDTPYDAATARDAGVVNTRQSKVAYAEMVTLERTAGKVPDDCKDLILVCTLEPCVMCLGAAMETAVDTVLFALPAPKDGGSRRVKPPLAVQAGILASSEESDRKLPARYCRNFSNSHPSHSSSAPP